MPYSASGTAKAPNVHVSMASTPTARYDSCREAITSGRTTHTISLQPSRSGPPKSSGPRSRSWMPVPKAPSKMTTRWRAAST